MNLYNYHINKIDFFKEYDIPFIIPEEMEFGFKNFARELRILYKNHKNTIWKFIVFKAYYFIGVVILNDKLKYFHIYLVLHHFICFMENQQFAFLINDASNKNLLHLLDNFFMNNNNSFMV